MLQPDACSADIAEELVTDNRDDSKAATFQDSRGHCWPARIHANGDRSVRVAV
jgi:hypothetical protein